MQKYSHINDIISVVERLCGKVESNSWSLKCDNGTFSLHLSWAVRATDVPSSTRSNTDIPYQSRLTHPSPSNLNDVAPTTRRKKKSPSKLRRDRARLERWRTRGQVTHSPVTQSSDELDNHVLNLESTPILVPKLSCLASAVVSDTLAIPPPAGPPVLASVAVADTVAVTLSVVPEHCLASAAVADTVTVPPPARPPVLVSAAVADTVAVTPAVLPDPVQSLSIDPPCSANPTRKRHTGFTPTPSVIIPCDISRKRHCTATKDSQPGAHERYLSRWNDSNKISSWTADALSETSVKW